MKNFVDNMISRSDTDTDSDEQTQQRERVTDRQTERIHVTVAVFVQRRALKGDKRKLH